MDTIIISKTKFENHIIDHFDSEGKYDYVENGKTEFAIEFVDTDKNETGKYKFGVIYDPFYRKVYDIEHLRVYKIIDTGDEEVNIKLKTDNNNPCRLSLFNELQKILEKQLKVDEENAKSIRDIKENNKWLNENCR